MKYDFTFSYFLRILVETTLGDKILVVCLAPFSLFLTFNVVLGLQKAVCPRWHFFGFFFFFIFSSFFYSHFLAFNVVLGLQKVGCLPSVAICKSLSFYLFYLLSVYLSFWRWQSAEINISLSTFFIFLCFYLCSWPLMLQKVGCLPSVAIRRDK